MGSRKMVPINLFIGQQWRNRHREQTYGNKGWGGEGEDEMCGQSTMETYITICIYNRMPTGICCVVQGTQAGAL